MRDSVGEGGGSFATCESSGARAIWDGGKNTFGFSRDESRTDRYLNEPVLRIQQSVGTTGDFSVSYDRDITGERLVSA